MGRLPIPGSDDGTWGDILNSYLEVSHASDGTLNSGVVGTTQLQNNAVTNAKLDSATQTTIASVAGKYTKPGGGIPSSDMTAAVQTNLTAAGTAVQSVNGKNGTAVSLAPGDIGAEATVNKDVASGYAGLDSSGLLKVSELPKAAGVVVALGNVSGTVTCNLSAGIAFTATITGDTTFQFTNWPSAGLVEPEIYTVQDGTGGHAISVTGVVWEPTGSPPTFSTAPGAVNIIPVASFNGGTNTYGLTGLQGPAGVGVCTFSMPGALIVKTGASRQYFESSFTITTVRASVNTPSVGSSIICDVKKNGTTIYTTQADRPTIAAGTNTATANNPDITSLSPGDYLTVDVVQIGSTTAGADLTVTVTVR